MAIDPSVTAKSSPEPAAHAAADVSIYAEGLKPRDPLFRLAQRIFRVELDALRANLRPERALPLPQEIHQSRIALRRLRVALGVFRDFMPAEVEHFRVEFRWLAQALGEQRDLDVYEETLASAIGSDAPLPPILKRDIARARRGASTRLVALLGSKRFSELLVAFAAFAGADLPPAVQRRWQSLRIRDAIEGDLRRSVKRVVKCGRRIDAASPPEDLHELRIRAKRLRYETEFYAAFSTDLGELTRGAKQIQDLLGSHRDAIAAAERLTALSGTRKRDAKAVATITPLIRRQNERAAELRRRFPRAWRKFEKIAAATKPRRKPSKA